MEVVPLSFRAACAFIAEHHRHNKPPRGMKFAIGVSEGDQIVGVATAGRPVARGLDDGLTLEVNRTCTSGHANANSMLYGAARRIAKEMGYRRVITYTQGAESGGSIRAAGFRVDKEIDARGSWAESSVKLRHIRDSAGTGGVARVRWIWP